MSLTLGIALNLIADTGLLSILGWAMSRPVKLTPHRPARPHLEVLHLSSGEDVVVAGRPRRAA